MNKAHILMKKAHILMVLAVTLASVAVAQAAPSFSAYSGPTTNLSVNLVECSDTGNYCDTGSYGGGGFQATLYSGSTREAVFPTFCVETQVEFSPGSTYTATIDNRVLDSTGELVNYKVQYLYEQFLMGNLGSSGSGATQFNYSNQNSYTALQEVIWNVLGQPGVNGWNGTLSGNDATTDGIAQALLTYATANASMNTSYGVEALNLWNGTAYSGTDAQSQLIWTGGGVTTQSTPEPASIVLLGVGLIGFAAAKRARRIL